jgi:hypothetical protein
MPRPLYSQGKSPWYHWIRGCVGLRADLDAVVKRKILSPCRDLAHMKCYMYMKYEQFLKV